MRRPNHQRPARVQDQGRRLPIRERISVLVGGGRRRSDGREIIAAQRLDGRPGGLAHRQVDVDPAGSAARARAKTAIAYRPPSGYSTTPASMCSPGRVPVLAGHPDARREAGRPAGSRRSAGPSARGPSRSRGRRPGLVPPDQLEQPGDLPGVLDVVCVGVEDPHGPDPVRRQRREDPGELRVVRRRRRRRTSSPAAPAARRATRVAVSPSSAASIGSRSGPTRRSSRSAAVLSVTDMAKYARSRSDSSASSAQPAGAPPAEPVRGRAPRPARSGRAGRPPPAGRTPAPAGS